MNSKDELFDFYLSTSDVPIVPNGEIHSNINQKSIRKLLHGEDVLEEVVIDGINAITAKRLLVNPFLDENLRCNMFEEIISSTNCDDKMTEMCIDSFFSNNTQSNFNRIASRTSSFIDWKNVKKEVIKSLYSDFIKKHGRDEDAKDIDVFHNKIFNN